MLSALLVRMVQDALDEFAYPALLAGQTWALSRSRRGITVRLSGWSDKQDLLLARIVSTLRALPLPARRFEAQKSEYARHLRNAGERKPFRRAMSEVRALMIEPDWSDDTRLEALGAVELEDLREYAVRFFECGEIVALAHGNVTAEDAKALGSVVEHELLGSMRVERVAEARVVRLDPGMRFTRWLASEHEDHALAVYAQGRDTGLAERAKIALIVRAMRDRFFHELRAERKIGYIAFTTFLPMLEVPGLALVLQSPSNPPETLHRHVDAFIERFGDALREMPNACLRAPPDRGGELVAEAETRLGERTVRYWSEIDRESYEFDRPRAVSRGGACRHPGRDRGCRARPRRRPGDGSRGWSSRSRTASLRRRRGVPGCGVGGRHGRIQARAALLRRSARGSRQDRYFMGDRRRCARTRRDESD